MVWAVTRRELLSLWVTPLAWSLLCAFSLIHGAAFVATLNSLVTFGATGIDVGPTQAFFGQSIFVPLGYLLVCPLLTMRSLAEERRSGTAELLLSSALTSAQIVLGKYLALALTYLTMWLPTLLYPYILRETGQIEWGVVAASYVGVLGLGLGFVSVGVLASSAVRNQLVAALLSGTVIFSLLLCGLAEQTYQEEPLHSVLSQLSIASLLAECGQGILSLQRLVYMASLIALPLFLATRRVESWRDG
jgi:ABC-2 type transport system permease protein